MESNPMAVPGRLLLELMLDKHHVSASLDDLRAVHLKRQVCNVDLVVVMEFISQPKVCFVVEDKIDATLSGDDQLLRNIKAITEYKGEWEPLRRNLRRDRVYGMLVKSGYDFDFIPPERYQKINQADLLNWIRKFSDQLPSASDTIEDWTAWFLSQVECDRRSESSAEELLSGLAMGDSGQSPRPPVLCDNRKYISVWGKPVFQYTLFKRLFGVSSQRITSVTESGNDRVIQLRPDYDLFKPEQLHQGRSRGGHWINYNFTSDTDGSGNFYYRLDFRKGMWGIMLRYYKKSKSAEDIQRMVILRELFVRARGRRIITLASYPRYDTCNESTIVFIDPQTSRDLQELYDVHKQFMAEAFPRTAPEAERTVPG
jgi:hypothetical protein